MDFKVKRVVGCPSEVVATPSDPVGVFIYKHERIGLCAVSELTLLNFPGEVQRAVEEGDLSLMGNVVYRDYSDEHVIRFSDISVGAVVEQGGLPMHVRVLPRRVMEMVPVTVDIPPHTSSETV